MDTAASLDCGEEGPLEPSRRREGTLRRLYWSISVRVLLVVGETRSCPVSVGARVFVSQTSREATSAGALRLYDLTPNPLTEPTRGKD